VVVEMKPIDPCTGRSYGCSSVSFSCYPTGDMLAAEDCNARRARQEIFNKVIKILSGGFRFSHFLRVLIPE
jgi:hypothetical protein